ncbi:hypothetical protein L1049_001429 [Liquidambar formosana]|uniref:EF-hand domain-containing protein n=1 Tax=Liquidambar formosana TaxID=63359 RepID=A0AAP0NCD5_LIQFO
MRKISRIGYCTLLLLLLLLMVIVEVKGRSLSYSSSEMVSDGVDHVQHNQPSFLLFRGMEYSSEECEQLYGFLPCSNSALGHLFLIVVYEYLLFHGESYVAAGGEMIFKILGPGVFGASAFQVLGALPESFILLASGLLNTKEVAEEYVFTGVGLLAGSTILLLTVLWGTCVIVGSQNLSDTSESDLSDGSDTRKETCERLFSPLTGSGISTDLETSYTARIMVLSVIPFIIIQIPKIFPSSTVQNIVTLVALFVSAVFLLLYFFYQTFQPWIQKRRLEYVKHEHLILKILQHVQNHALARILTDDGAPNVLGIRRLFEEIDRDGDDFISPSELKELLLQIKFRKSDADKDKAMAEVLKQFDMDGDRKITKEEFVDAITRWLDETKQTINKEYYSKNSLKSLYEVFQPWIQNRRREHEMRKELISGILRHVQSHALGSLVAEDGTPNTPNIRGLFEKIDLDGDNCISQPELKQLIMDLKFGDIPLDADEAVSKMMEEFDTSGDHLISEEEFVAGFAKWLNPLNNQDPHTPTYQDDVYQKTWEETDMLVDDDKRKGVVNEKSPWAWLKAIMFLVVGIVILAILAEPLIESVQNFSKAASIPSFFVSFILVPLATSARAATSAIKAARRKKSRTTSLTFSEIYSGVFMNNILGFCVLLSLIHARGLTWDFSAEVLVVVIVCAIVGLSASFCSAFPVWSSIIAYLLYPLSLLLVYFLDDVLQYS